MGSNQLVLKPIRVGPEKSCILCGCSASQVTIFQVELFGLVYRTTTCMPCYAEYCALPGEDMPRPRPRKDLLALMIIDVQEKIKDKIRAGE